MSTYDVSLDNDHLSPGVVPVQDLSAVCHRNQGLSDLGFGFGAQSIRRTSREMERHPYVDTTGENFPDGCMT
jgi:hypothetical protein